MNRIFSYRADEPVQVDTAVPTKLRKDFQKPDAIFGLRETSNIENLLYDTRKPGVGESIADNSDRKLHELLDPSPLAQPVSARFDKILFPFLVSEAKSGTSGNDWYSIDLQTAFPIKAFLDTQNRLRQATGRWSRWHAGPLVWYFSNKGEDWRLSAACLAEGEPRNGTIDYMGYVSAKSFREPQICLVSDWPPVGSGALERLD